MSTRARLILGAICAIYIAARIWRLDESCLWFDEIFSVHAAEHPWSELFSFIAKDLIHPPLFYMLLKLWIGIGGESVFWLRLLPVIFSVLALIPFVYLGRELKFSPPVMIIATSLFAMNGALIKYTQTLRMYSMLMFLALLSMWLFARYFNRGKSFIPLVIANLLLIYTHYFGWLVIATEIVAILWFQRIKWRRVVVMSGILAVAYVPWVIAVVNAAKHGSSLSQNIAWQSRPGIRQLVTFATDLVEPFYFQSSSAEPGSIYFVSLPLILIFLTALILYFMGWKNEERKQHVYLLVFFAAFPLIVAFIASWLLPHSVWGTRHLIVIFPPLMILTAHAMYQLSIPVARVAIVSIVGALSIVGFAVDASRAAPNHVWCEWNNVANRIKEADAGNANAVKIYTFENLVAYHLWFALRDAPRFQVDVVRGVDVQTEDEAYFLPRGFDGVDQIGPEQINDEEMWLAFRTWRRDGPRPLLKFFEGLDYKNCSNNLPAGVQYGPIEVFSLKMRRGKCP